MRRLAAVAALLLAGPCHADTIGVHTVSWHSKPGFNNVNPGLYWRDDSGLTVGAYRNSYRRNSVYAGWTWSTRGDLSVALTVGAITGYQQSPLFVAPSVALRLDTWTVRVVGLPKPPQDASGAAVVHLMLEKTL